VLIRSLNTFAVFVFAFRFCGEKRNKLMMGLR
jgi:hypothetical protein